MTTTKIFLDSCSPIDTINTIKLLNHLDGQTTNPSLLVKNPKLQSELVGGKISESRLLELYKNAIIEISNLIPNGSVSIEVYADKNSTPEDLLLQANEFATWIPNAHIKFPTTKSGLEAAEIFVNNGGKVNMTLVFSQEQALAVHLATQNAKNKGDVFVSPFVGRLDDIGMNGIDLVSNILDMYKKLDSKVEVLGASLRTISHINKCVNLGCDIITAPISALDLYKNQTNSLSIEESNQNLQPIPYQDFTQTTWKDCNIQHDLTDKGLDKFVADWKSVLLD